MWGTKKDKGLFFEQQASDWLQQKGLEPVQQNFNCRFGEIDLIMRDADTLCFIEVKYRSSNAFGGTAYSIPASKQKKIIRSALTFIALNKPLQQLNYRFDALFIQPQKNNQTNHIEWIQNAFSAPTSAYY